MGGTDYAWGGAETGTGLSAIYNTPNIGTQIGQYLATSPTITGTQLFTIWGGANDFLHGGVTNPMIPVNNLISDITTLAAAGGKQFLVPNLPLLGELPATSSTPYSGPLNYLTLQFDSLLHTQLNLLQQQLGVTIYQVDVNSVFENIMADPAAYGITNVTDPAYLNPNYQGQGYLFWDTVHPTTEIQQLIGNIAAATVPEPTPIHPPSDCGSPRAGLENATGFHITRSSAQGWHRPSVELLVLGGGWQVERAGIVGGVDAVEQGDNRPGRHSRCRRISKASPLTSIDAANDRGPRSPAGAAAAPSGCA